jgi:hypothetical protein
MKIEEIFEDVLSLGENRPKEGYCKLWADHTEETLPLKLKADKNAKLYYWVSSVKLTEQIKVFYSNILKEDISFVRVYRTKNDNFFQIHFTNLVGDKTIAVNNLCAIELTKLYKISKDKTKI